MCCDNGIDAAAIDIERLDFLRADVDAKAVFTRCPLQMWMHEQIRLDADPVDARRIEREIDARACADLQYRPAQTTEQTLPIPIDGGVEMIR